MARLSETLSLFPPIEVGGQARIVGVLDLGPIVDLGPIGFCKPQIEPQDGLTVGDRWPGVQPERNALVCSARRSQSSGRAPRKPMENTMADEFTFLGGGTGIGLVLLVILLL